MAGQNRKKGYDLAMHDNLFFQKRNINKNNLETKDTLKWLNNCKELIYNSYYTDLSIVDIFYNVFNIFLICCSLSGVCFGWLCDLLLIFDLIFPCNYSNIFSCPNNLMPRIQRDKKYHISIKQEIIYLHCQNISFATRYSLYC